MPTRLRPYLVALALGLVACGAGPEPDHSGPTSLRLSLEHAGSTQDAGLMLIEEFKLPEDGLPDWEFTGDEPGLSASAEPRYLELGAGRVDVTLQLTAEPGDFNQVAVTFIPARPRQLQLLPGRPGEGGRPTPAQHLRIRHKPVTILFDMFGEAWGDELSRTLTLSFLESGSAAHAAPGKGRAKRSFGLVSIALLHRPLHNWLPRASDGAELIPFGEEARRGVGLVTGQTLEGTFEVGAWRELSLSHGVPPVAWAGGDALSLRVTLTDSVGTTRSERFPSTEHWKLERLSLSGLTGSVTARVEAEAEGGGAGLLALGEVRLEHARSQPPAVLLITSDTHRADHLATMDLGVDVRTPVLDALAERGVLFTDCVTSANVTHPSHVALMSGHAPRDTGVVNNTELVSEEPVLLAEHFRDAGWTTYAAVSVRSLDHARSGLGQGFDRVLAPMFGIRDSSLTIRQLLDALPDAEGQPLFVWLHLFDAHTPYREHSDLSGLYYPHDRDPRDLALPELAPWQRAHGQAGVRDIEYPLALYRAEVSYLDAQLEQVLEHDRFEREIIAFTSDHGESLTSHHVWFGHEELYPQTLHVPLILTWPGGPRGLRVERPVQQIDVGHTLLTLAGLEARGFTGRDLTQDDAGPAPRFALGAGAISASVYADSWFLMLRLRDYQGSDLSQPPGEAHVIELYDLSADPACAHDLVEQQPEVAAKLRRLLINWLVEAPETGWNSLQSSAAADDLKQLADLGYTTDMRTSTSTEWFDPECSCDVCARWESTGEH